MIVCHCTATNDSTVREAIASGADEVQDVAQVCGAGSDCGGCHRTIKRLLAHSVPRPNTSPPEPAARRPAVNSA